LPFSGLLSLVVPDSNGLCIAGGLNPPGPNAIELVGYVGAAALVLAVTGIAVGLVRRRADLRGRLELSRRRVGLPGRDRLLQPSRA